ncbi:MAG: hypothetical protein Q9223_000339 [Gallowayella weberi]
MADDHKTFLAERILNEAQQNSKKPGSVHAIYLITGIVVPKSSEASAQVEQADGEDAYMQSSPFMSSSMPHRRDDEELLAVKSITICRQEDLQEVKARFDGKTSIHVYSLGPSTIQDMHILSDCNRAAAAQCAAEDPLQAGRQYGTIQNARVKRRTGPRPLPPQSASIMGKGSPGPKASTPVAKIETTAAKAESPKALQGQASVPGEVKLNNGVRQHSSQEKKPAPKAPTMKREQSDIFKSFSKPQPTISRENTQSSTVSEDVPSVSDDESIDDTSGNEHMEDAVSRNEKAASSGRNTRSDREDQLRRLWDDDEETAPVEKSKTISDHQGPEQSTGQLPAQQGEQVVAISAAASGGRRRGRRKIMKKKTLKDDEGYLVTKEEPAWESFSEDEPAPKESTPASTASSMPKGKKATGKPGQGNIMSFFGKK